jgi:hypothetical protein
MRGADCRKVRIEGEGYRMMRFWNNDVLSNRDGVLMVILQPLLRESCVWLPLTPPSPRSATLRRERE